MVVVSVVGAVVLEAAVVVLEAMMVASDVDEVVQMVVVVEKYFRQQIISSRHLSAEMWSIPKEVSRGERWTTKAACRTLPKTEES